MDIRIIDGRITRGELQALAQQTFGEMVKAVADVERGILAVGGELHADAEALLLEQGSDPHALWGFNIHFRDTLTDSLEYSSLINIRPRQHNKSLQIKDADVREAILKLVGAKVDWSR